jgi:hypothetical protein
MIIIQKNTKGMSNSNSINVLINLIITLLLITKI